MDTEMVTVDASAMAKGIASEGTWRPLSPVSPNETEGGRAKNRRVELVKQ